MKRPARWAGMAGLMLFVTSGNAAEEGTFRPFVSYTRYYDSNLFRLDRGESTVILDGDDPEIVTRDEASDQYGSLAAGLTADWRPGRQRILASASHRWVRFENFTSLDYEGSDYQLKWDWRLGNRLSGQAGATQTVSQTSFADWYTLEAFNNELTHETRFVSADWQFHPRWSVGLGATETTAENSRAVRAPLDYENDSLAVTLGYTTPKGSKLRLQLREIDGEYPNRPLGYVDREYTQTEVNVLGDWTVGGKLIAHGRVGYVRRENETVSQRDFSGIAGRVSGDYALTGKVLVSGAVYRELANSDDFNASYKVTTGSRLGVSWGPTAKVIVRASAVYENRNFRGETGAPPTGLPRRDEDTVSGAVSVGYAPVRPLSMEVGLQSGGRDSNLTFSDYSFRSVFASVRADF